MAVTLKPLYPLKQAKERRVELGRYLRLDGGRYLIAAALLLSLMSLVSLGQTGRLATQGYELAQLEQRKVVLLRERSRMQLQLSEAQSLGEIERRASDQGLRPMTPDQARYVTVAPELSVAPADTMLAP
ncbi:MAG: hypothetical protein RLZZ387_2832 [Chloroflexota bacterium]|jgi:Zn-dependent protease with chaperone function